MKQISLLLLLASVHLAWGQEPKERKKLPAQKIDQAPQIDGRLDDAVWQGLPVATDFIMRSPDIGTPAPERFRSRVQVAYSDEALFVAAQLYDRHGDSILHQVTERDVYNENTDWFRVALNPFNDGQNQFKFVVTAAGTKTDLRTNANGQDDPSYNTIWESAITRSDSGWQVELAIPYVALRFPRKNSAQWGLNFTRSIRRNRHEYSWNPVDRGSGYSQAYQAGLLSGMTGIDPPVRLSFMPYLSAYRNDFRGETNHDFNAGLDVKYGLGPSFTLDATLIPDFGQVAFDNQILNLSPYENRFQENRQFFNEGTELFSIGDLFYSRRIGGEPKNITNQNLDEEGTVEARTEYTQLLNATKVSGRTSGNLGIGVLNAVTDESFRTVTDTTGRTERQLLEPLTNYNVVVLDQRFNRNSSVSFINTNTWREGGARDANVAGLLTSIYDGSGQYRLDGSVKRSDIFTDTARQTGYEASLRLGDVDGQWRWATLQTLSTDDYDINDMGFQQRNNQIRNYSEVSFQTFKPQGPFNRTSYTLYNIYSSLYQPQRFEEWAVGFNAFFLLRDFTGTQLRLRASPVSYYDYFEPRLPGRYLRRPPRFSAFYMISTDYRKPLALDGDFRYEYRTDWQAQLYTLNLNPRIRLGDHLFFLPRFRWEYQDDDIGFAAKDDDRGESFMGRRQVRNLTASIEGRYAFDPQSSLSLRLRQYWSRVEYREIFFLGPQGNLRPSDRQDVKNINFNTLNLDLRYSWWFAPASQLTLLYRVALAQRGSRILQDYGRNLDQALANPAQSNLSLKLNYFLDFHQTKKQLRQL